MWKLSFGCTCNSTYLPEFVLVLVCKYYALNCLCSLQYICILIYGVHICIVVIWRYKLALCCFNYKPPLILVLKIVFLIYRDKKNLRVVLDNRFRLQCCKFVSIGVLIDSYSLFIFYLLNIITTILNISGFWWALLTMRLAFPNHF